MVKKKEKNQAPITQGELRDELTEFMGGFTEEVLLPAVKNIVKDEVKKVVKKEIRSEIGKHRHEMKSYIDDKLVDTKGDIIAYIKGDRVRDKSWKLKVVDILKKNKLAKLQDIKMLAELIR